MKRQLAILLALCLLLSSGQGGFATAQLHLVCRLSGLPMTAVLQTAPQGSQTASCCQVRRVSAPVSLTQTEPLFALRAGSCCVLRVTSTGRYVPSAAVPASFFHVSVARAPQRISETPLPVFTNYTPLLGFAQRSSPPRAPPARAALGRAPPFFIFS